MQHFNYSLDDINHMMPWEREIYMIMLNEHLKEKQRMQEQQNMRS